MWTPAENHRPTHRSKTNIDAKTSFKIAALLLYATRNMHTYAFNISISTEFLVLAPAYNTNHRRDPNPVGWWFPFSVFLMQLKQSHNTTTCQLVFQSIKVSRRPSLRTSLIHSSASAPNPLPKLCPFFAHLQSYRVNCSGSCVYVAFWPYAPTPPSLRAQKRMQNNTAQRWAVC